VRLIHRRGRSTPLAENDVYQRSYGEHVDHVDVIHLEPPPLPLEAAPEPDQVDHHVTTERLKRQFEERLAGRRRRRGPR
jgi:hypothetical protein